MVRRLMAVALAAGLHLLILFGLGRTVAQLDMRPRGEDETNAISVTMVRPSSPAGRPDVAPVGKVRPRPETLPTNPLPPVPIAPGPPAPVQEAPVAKPDTDALQKTLRGLVGCADPGVYRLSPQERSHCEHRSGAPAPVTAQIDAGAQAAFDADATRQDPLLIRKPHNGCLPRAGDRKSALVNGGRGSSMSATTAGGVGCAWAF